MVISLVMLLLLVLMLMLVLLMLVLMLVLVVRTHQDVGGNRKEVPHRHRKIQHSGCYCCCC